MKPYLLVAILIPVCALAQTPGIDVFPASSTAASAQELTAYLAGKSFRARYADGTTVESKFGADGSLSATAPRFHDTGRWRVEDGKLCGSLRKVGEFCNEARFDSGTLYLKRMNGEVIHYEPE